MKGRPNQKSSGCSDVDDRRATPKWIRMQWTLMRRVGHCIDRHLGPLEVPPDSTPAEIHARACHQGIDHSLSELQAKV
jgi:hypothetical protein